MKYPCARGHLAAAAPHERPARARRAARGRTAAGDGADGLDRAVAADRRRRRRRSDPARLGEEVAGTEGARGRPARSLAFRADAGYVFGVDIGEVKVRTAVADLRGAIVAERVREFAGEERLPVIRRTIARDAGRRGALALGAVVLVRGVHGRDGHGPRARAVLERLRRRLRPRGRAGAARWAGRW